MVEVFFKKSYFFAVKCRCSCFISAAALALLLLVLACRKPSPQPKSESHQDGLLNPESGKQLFEEFKALFVNLGKKRHSTSGSQKEAFSAKMNASLEKFYPTFRQRGRWVLDKSALLQSSSLYFDGNKLRPTFQQIRPKSKLFEILPKAAFANQSGQKAVYVEWPAAVKIEDALVEVDKGRFGFEESFFDGFWHNPRAQDFRASIEQRTRKGESFSPEQLQLVNERLPFSIAEMGGEPQVTFLMTEQGIWVKPGDSPLHVLEDYLKQTGSTKSLQDALNDPSMFKHWGVLRLSSDLTPQYRSPVTFFEGSSMKA